jgi:asparagine synthase (glutamine-hydrolysing)
MGRGIGLGAAYVRRSGGALPLGAGRPVMPRVGTDGIRLVADVDLDERDRLAAELAGVGIVVHEGADDAELIAAAYRAWGVACPERLHGDFAIALWDDRRDQLLLARDRFGTRPLYYACISGALVFANSLDVLRMHPGVTAALDEGAVGDFLRFGYNTDPSSTIFASVRCVPAAHRLVFSGGDSVVTRYWDLPTDGTIRHRRMEDYVDQFAELLQNAVADRIRGADAAVLLLSGGRDSTAVAAMARAAAGRNGPPRLHAVTAVFDYAIPDAERTYAGLAAGALDIPVDFVPQDEYGWYESWDRDDLWRPEPPESPQLASEVDLYARAAAHARLGLTGEGGDAALRESESHLARLIQSGHLWRAGMESSRYVRVHHRLPRPGVRRLRQRRAGSLAAYSIVPPWLRVEFIVRAKLRDRWDALEADDSRQQQRHPTRPEAFTKLRSTFWPRCFEGDHVTSTGQLLTLRHPFFDERVIAFLLALPTEQWLNDKGIVVATMRGRLPARVVYRGKTPLAGDPYEVAFASRGRRPDRAAFEERALRFVDPDLLFADAPGMGQDDRWNWVRAYSFSRWLARLGVGRRFSSPQNVVIMHDEPVGPRNSS